jgi:type IV pilus assembly protein PilE
VEIQMNHVHKKGFTIIELMIVLAIVAILVALAVPSFQDTIRKSRRSDAMNAILGIHLAQERYRANNIAYGDLAALGIADDPMPSPDGHYNLTITGEAATTYTIAADALGDQDNDACRDFTLTFDAGVITKTADGDDATCWKR